MKIAGILLAAGASQRFGIDDKLLVQLQGQPLVTHAAAALKASEPDVLIGVTRTSSVANVLVGFENVICHEPRAQQSDSLKVGLKRAIELGASKVVIALGDMPFVNEELIRAVVDCSTDSSPAAASDGKRSMPPVCFPSAYFDDLLALKGDRGATELLKNLPACAIIETPDLRLYDVDTPDALLKAERISEHAL
ncbi:MAG: nucleotidyltransferase family protein [Pseudomonadota bacterium]